MAVQTIMNGNGIDATENRTRLFGDKEHDITSLHRHTGIVSADDMKFGDIDGNGRYDDKGGNGATTIPQEEEVEMTVTSENQIEHIGNKPRKPHTLKLAGTPSHLCEFNVDGTEQYIDTLLQTRPILLDSNSPKSSFRVVLRGLFYGKPNTSSGLYAMGSLDGERWMYLGGTERRHTSTPVRDIGTTIERYSCKLLMVVFVGSLLSNSKIDNFELTTNEKYNDKIR